MVSNKGEAAGLAKCLNSISTGDHGVHAFGNKGKPAGLACFMLQDVVNRLQCQQPVQLPRQRCEQHCPHASARYCMCMHAVLAKDSQCISGGDDAHMRCE